jgi:hypothetical protein
MLKNGSKPVRISFPQCVVLFYHSKYNNSFFSFMVYFGK